MKKSCFPEFFPNNFFSMNACNIKCYRTVIFRLKYSKKSIKL